MEPLLAALYERKTDATVTADGETVDFAALSGRAASVASRVAGLQRVAVRAEPTQQTIAAVAGALAAGVAVVPVPSVATGDEVAHYLSDSGAQAWVGPAPSSGDLPVIPTDDVAGAELPSAVVDSEHTALVLYTSGTTGRPKGVLLSHRAVAACLDGLFDAWQWSSTDRLAHGLPLYHLHGLGLGVLGPLRNGSSVTHVGRPTPQAYAAADATMYFGVPTIWSRISRDAAAARQLRSARLLVSGSAALPEPVATAMLELAGQQPLERYGMSETLITLAARSDQPRRLGSVGGPVAGVRARIVDADGDLVPADGTSLGSLQIAGPTLFSGYLNQPAQTADSFTADGWFVTGDVATVDEAGGYRIVGRESVDLIKSGGYRIGAGEIEAVLLAHAGVDEVAVVGEPDDDLGQRVVAYVVPHDGVKVSPDVLAEHTQTRLARYKQPREFRMVEGLPRNQMGKVNKKALLARTGGTTHG